MEDLYWFEAKYPPQIIMIPGKSSRIFFENGIACCSCGPGITVHPKYLTRPVSKCFTSVFHGSRSRFPSTKVYSYRPSMLAPTCRMELGIRCLALALLGLNRITLTLRRYKFLIAHGNWPRCYSRYCYLLYNPQSTRL